MVTSYPAVIDGYSNIRVVRDGTDEVVAADHNDLRSAVIAMEQVLGTSPQGVYGTVDARIAELEVMVGGIGVAGGDLSGTYPNPNVVGLRGRSLSSTTPAGGDVLTWNGAAWVPAPSGGGGGPHALGGVEHIPDTLAHLNDKVSDADLIATTTAAGGDLGGTYPNPTVAAIRGRAVGTSVPNTNDVLTWNGAQWTPAAPGGGGAPSGPAGGDLSGTYPNPTVAKIQGYAASNHAPTDGYAVTWSASGSQYISSKPIPGGPAGGDLSGTYPNPVVAGIQGRMVDPTAPTDGWTFVWSDAMDAWEMQTLPTVTSLLGNDSMVEGSSAADALNTLLADVIALQTDNLIWQWNGIDLSQFLPETVGSAVLSYDIECIRINGFMIPAIAMEVSVGNTYGTWWMGAVTLQPDITTPYDYYLIAEVYFDVLQPYGTAVLGVRSTPEEGGTYQGYMLFVGGDIAPTMNDHGMIRTINYSWGGGQDYLGALNMYDRVDPYSMPLWVWGAQSLVGAEGNTLVHFGESMGRKSLVCDVYAGGEVPHYPVYTNNPPLIGAAAYTGGTVTVYLANIRAYAIPLRPSSGPLP